MLLCWFCCCCGIFCCFPFIIAAVLIFISVIFCCCCFYFYFIAMTNLCTFLACQRVVIHRNNNNNNCTRQFVYLCTCRFFFGFCLKNSSNIVDFLPLITVIIMILFTFRFDSHTLFVVVADFLALICLINHNLLYTLLNIYALTEFYVFFSLFCFALLLLFATVISLCCWVSVSYYLHIKTVCRRIFKLIFHCCNQNRSVI